MGDGPELEIDKDLYSALVDVLGRMPDMPEPIVVLSAYMHLLAKGYGLSESLNLPESQLERADPPEPAMALINHYLAEVGADGLRNRLYEVFVDLSQDGQARRVLNRNEPLSEVGLLTVAQIIWNLEGTAGRSGLPIRSGQEIEVAGKRVIADIKVPSKNKDFATMTWTERTNQGGEGLGAGPAYRSSGQGFRTKGARLTVLAAQRIMAADTQPAPSLDGAVFATTSTDSGRPRAVVWRQSSAAPVRPGTQPVETAGTRRAYTVATDAATRAASAVEEPAPWKVRAWDDQRHTRHFKGEDATVVPGALRQVLVGRPGEVGSSYQRRGFDAVIERIWADGGDRRIWLRGGPGLGKSFSARQVMQEAVAHQGPDRDKLLVWVDSADPASVTAALSTAVDRMPHLGIAVARDRPDHQERQARALLEALANSQWRWFIVLDNADAGALITTGLVPPGANPNGRVLITTLSQDNRMSSNGRVVPAELFTPEEAEAYLRGQRDARNGGPAPLARAPRADTIALAEAVGYHPLALSIAAATIVSNSMEVTDWIAEFTATDVMDVAADTPDAGGYPHLIGATWRVALGRASQGLPDGVVERAAAVAALLDPDGHPTWLWDRDPVNQWVAHDSVLARSHGRPIAVQRLIDYGIVALVGDTWKQGQVTTHQLAARAVRELVSAEALAKLGEILVDEIRTSDSHFKQPSDLLRNMRHILSIPGIPETVKCVASSWVGSMHQAMGQERDALAAYRTANEIAVSLARDDQAVRDFAATNGKRTERFVRGYLPIMGLVEIGDVQENLGCLDDARASRTRAAEIYQQLIDCADSEDGDLAGLLQRLGELQEQVGRLELANGSRTRAAGIYQRLLEAPEVNDDDLAGYLSRLGLLQFGLGRLDEAEKSCTRWVEILQQRGGDGDLESAWSRLAEVQKRLGLLDKAVESEIRAVEVTERLVEAGFRGRRAYLAAALENLGLWVLELPARGDEAEGYFARAEEISEQLAEERPGDHEESLALRLWGLSLAQWHNGRPEEATESLTRAIRIVQLLEDLTPGSHEHVLASMLKMLGSHQQALGRLDEAAGSFVREVRIRELLAVTDPVDHEHNLYNALHSAGQVLLELERFDEAESVLARSLEIAEKHVREHPGEHGHEIAHMLSQLALAQLGLGKPDEADDHLTQAVNIFQLLVDANPDEHQYCLSFSLRLLGTTKRQLGRLDEAEDAFTRAVDIMQLLADEDPSDENLDSLADRLDDLGRTRFEIGRLDEAEVTFTRLAENRELLTTTDPSDHDAQGKLAESLLYLGYVRGELGRQDDAVNVLTRSTNIYQLLADIAPADHEAQVNLATARGILARFLRSLHRLDEAEATLASSVAIFQVLADMSPGSYEQALRKVLGRLGEVLRDLGRLDDAERAVARADELERRFPLTAEDEAHG